MAMLVITRGCIYIFPSNKTVIPRYPPGYETGILIYHILHYDVTLYQSNDHKTVISTQSYIIYHTSEYHNIISQNIIISKYHIVHIKIPYIKISQYHGMLICGTMICIIHLLFASKLYSQFFCMCIVDLPIKSQLVHLSSYQSQYNHHNTRISEYHNTIVIYHISG